MRKKTSPIWSIDIENLKLVIQNSYSYTQVLKHFGFTHSNLNTLKRRINADNISVKHFSQEKIRKQHLQKLGTARITPWSEVLVKNSRYRIGSSRKKRLVEEGLLEYKCQISPCPMDIYDISYEWGGKKVTLILDHINGNNRDHRISNLRFVCPWCNSLLDTHAGRNQKRRQIKRCIDCKTPISQRAKKCNSCAKSKIDWPSIEILLNEVEASSLTRVAKKYEVSGNAVKKRIKRFFPDWRSSYIPVPPKKKDN